MKAKSAWSRECGRLRQWLCWSGLGFGLVLAGAAQPGGPSTNRPVPVQGLVIRSWGTEAGLPQNTVNAIVQTRDGYLWLATRDGVARFDGVRFTVFGLP